MTACVCACHVNPFGWVPVCPLHYQPLYAAEAGRGQCPWTGVRAERHVGGTEFTTNRCTTWVSSSWEWRPRAIFNLSDLPPHNGFQEPRYPEANGGRPWEIHLHPCPACGNKRDVAHVVGENRAVCTRCGLVSWLPDPAYVDEVI